MDLITMATQFYNSLFFSVLKFVVGIYVIVLLIDIILLLMQRGLSGNVRETSLGIDIPRELASKGGKLKLRKKWEKIKSKLDFGEERAYRVAVIEADEVINGLIQRLGYAGENMAERLDNVPSGQLDNIEELKRAHEIRNRIIHEDDFRLSKKEAEEAFSLFEEFLKYFEVL